MDAQASAPLQRLPGRRIRDQGRALNASSPPSPAVPTHRLAALREALGHAFRRPELLERALTHRSSGAPNNERLEYLGDAVLGCVIALALFTRLPGTPEGDLTRMRAHLVNGDTLARLGAGLGLDALVRIGEGEQKGGDAGRRGIVADALEAVFGAVFEDAGFDAARAAIERVYARELATASPATLGKDAKTALQEWLQARRHGVPDYAVVVVAGEAHAQTFTVECRIPALELVASGTGRSRRAAEQAAAAVALARLAPAAGEEGRR